MRSMENRVRGNGHERKGSGHREKKHGFALYRSRCRLEKIVDTEDGVLIVSRLDVTFLGCIHHEFLRIRKVENTIHMLRYNSLGDVNEVFTN